MNIKANIGFRDLGLVTPDVGFSPNINENVIDDLKEMNNKLEAYLSKDSDYTQLKDKAEHSRHYQKKSNQKYKKFK